MDIILKQLPETDIAFIRRTGNYFEPQEHWEKLIHWATENNLHPPSSQFIGISLDDPKVVNSQECRHDACITLPKNFNKTGHREIQFRILDGGQYIVHHFYDSPEKLKDTYEYIFEKWLPESEYLVDKHRSNLEFNLNNPAEDPSGKSRVDLHIPIKNKAIPNTN